MTRLSDALEIQLSTYAQIISGGGVVAFPTETVYGLGASAMNPVAIAKVFELKGRPADNPLIVHVSNYAMLMEFAADLPVAARLLIQKFWPGPLTLVLEKKSRVLDKISAGLPSVAVRMPDHELALRLIEMTGPLVAPSANLSGRPSPTCAAHVRNDFGNSVPVLDGGSCAVGLESTVVDVRTEPFRILRPGFISAEMILKRCNIVVADAESTDVERPASPGMKYSHYAPDARVFWLEGSVSQVAEPDTLYLVQQCSPEQHKLPNVVCFDGDMVRMAQELYDWFRRSDLAGFKKIAVEPLNHCLNQELAKALKNRIDKAVVRT
jgi:L-threonylcarbamoyladenylate synthase